MSTDYLTIEGFNTHFIDVHTYLNAHKTRLGISTANMDALNLIFEGTTPANDPMNWQDTWPTYSNPAIRNNNAEKNIGTLRKAAEKQMSVIYNDIPASKWTDADRNTLNRKTGAHASPTHHEEKIKLSCYGIVKKLGGGVLDFGCRKVNDASLPSVPKEEGADGVLISFSVVEKDATEGIPTTPDNCQKQKVFPGATFELDLKADNEGNRIYYFLQWHDSKHPDRSGPPGDRLSLIIG